MIRYRAHHRMGSIIWLLMLLLIIGKISSFSKMIFRIEGKPEANDDMIKKPLELQFSFILDKDLEPSDEITITLPHFSRQLAFNTSWIDRTVSDGGVILSPSTTFSGSWSETVSSNGYGRIGYLTLRTRFGITLPLKSVVAITILKSSKIGAVCGFPSSIAINDNTTAKANVQFITLTKNDTSGRIFEFTTHSGLGIGCKRLKNCNKHGKCDFCSQRCICDEGYGASTDLVQKGQDVDASCSRRICPSGKTFLEVPINNVAHIAYSECSNVGACDRSTGLCRCPAPYTGVACERIGCPNDCSGHGQCVSMKDYSHTISASYSFSEYRFQYGTPETMLTTTWDYDMIYGCICDSSWKVGYNKHETQLSEWFGPDCSQQRCPSGDDPYTPKDEENCHRLTQPGALGGHKGKAGNRCHIDCSRRGICDHQVGKCQCFSGSWGDNCGLIANRGTKQR